MNQGAAPPRHPLPSALECRGLVRSFNGIRAVQGVSAVFAPGVLSALVGPNGAGKTTLLGMLAGSLKPNEGDVLIGGRSIAGFPPWAVARKGVARCFQEGRVFARLTVLENLMVAQRAGILERLSACVLKRDVGGSSLLRQLRNRLVSVGLERHCDSPAGALSFGERKLLSLLIAVTADRDVLLVDEPASGVGEKPKLQIEGLLRTEAEKGRVVVIIEHDIQFVKRLVDVVYFMANGKMVTIGAPEAVFENQVVRSTYLGL